MKLNINKLLSGGALPFSTINLYYGIEYTPVEALIGGNNTTIDKPTKKEKDDDDDEFNLLSKEVINELLKNGLPNEVEDFLSDLYQYEKSQNGIFSSKKTNRNKLYQLANKASNIIHNRKQYDKALEIAKENDSLSDIAVSKKGGIYVRNVDDGKLDIVSFKEFDENRDKFYTMSYQDLIEARAYDPNTTFNKGISLFSDIRESVGMEKISNNIEEVIKLLGTTEITKENYATAAEVFGLKLKQMKPEEREQMLLLAQGLDNLGENALFKITQTLSGYSDYEAAFKYIYSVLPENLKRQLNANFIVNGGEENNPSNVILNALKLHEPHKDVTNITFDKASAERQDKVTGKQKTVRMTIMELLFEGSINKGTILFTDPQHQNGYAINLQGNVIAGLPLDNNKVEGVKPMLRALDSSGAGVGKYLDYNQAYCGAKKISLAALQNILYDGLSVAKVWVPVNSKGEVDFRTLSMFSQVEEYLKKEGILDMPNGPEKAIKINTAFYNAGLNNIKVDAEGNYTSDSKVQEFLLAYGYTEQGDVIKNNPYVKKLRGDEADYTNELMEQIFKSYNMPSPTEYFTGTYKAPILIKIKPNSFIDSKTLQGHGSTVNSTDLAEDILTSDRINNYGNDENKIMANTEMIFQ